MDILILSIILYYDYTIYKYIHKRYQCDTVLLSSKMIFLY